MYLSYSFGFMIASLAQATIVFVSENIGLSSLGVTMDAIQILVHIIAGQIAGYLFLYIWNNSDAMRNLNIWFDGLLIGLIFWAAIIPIASYLGKINWPLSVGMITTLVTLIAFLVYGFICSYTIKSVGRSGVSG